MTKNEADFKEFCKTYASFRRAAYEYGAENSLTLKEAFLDLKKHGEFSDFTTNFKKKAYFENGYQIDEKDDGTLYKKPILQ